MRRNLFWLSDEQWERIEPHLPTDVRGVERVNDRRVISGIVHVLKSGCRWCDCPPEYGPPTTIYRAPRKIPLVRPVQIRFGSMAARFESGGRRWGRGAFSI